MSTSNENEKVTGQAAESNDGGASCKPVQIIDYVATGTLVDRDEYMRCPAVRIVIKSDGTLTFTRADTGATVTTTDEHIVAIFRQDEPLQRKRPFLAELEKDEVYRGSLTTLDALKRDAVEEAEKRNA